MNETDNGYKNHETFLISMDVNNNHGAAQWLRVARARMAADTNGNADIELAGVLRLSYENQADLNLPKFQGIIHELIASAIERVDWLEIAQKLINTVKEHDRVNA